MITNRRLKLSFIACKVNVCFDQFPVQTREHAEECSSFKSALLMLAWLAIVKQIRRLTTYKKFE